MIESDFLGNIARRLGRPTPLSNAPFREAVGSPDFWTVEEWPAAKRIAQFQSELENVGGTVKVFDRLAALHDHLGELLSVLAPGRIGMWGGDTLSEFQLQETLAPYAVFKWGTHGVAEFQHVEVGITGCAFAIANTGTVVMVNDALRGRSVSVLPMVHIMLLRSAQIHTRMGTVLDEIADRKTAGSGFPSSIHFITGPSRSSDIENDQTIGVHGPAAVFALILD